MAKRKLKINNSAPDKFLKDNPDFDLLHFDFHDPTELLQIAAQLKTAGTRKRKSPATSAEDEQSQMDLLLSRYKAKQRTLRITLDPAVADKLFKQGFDSANKIASIPERKFVRLFAPVIDDDEQKAREIYAQAVDIAEKTMHLYANIKDTVASPHYNAASFKVIDRESSDYYKNIPSYQELFGSLDYLQCDECQSIFSPAAYFLDIMRITDEYITDSNVSPVRTIPPRYTLEERRPDLFEMELNCENTNTVIPYLQLVNEILKKNLERNEKIDDVYKALAVEKYPFRLPFNLPLAKTRQYLDHLEIPLYRVFRSILTTDRNEAHIQSFDVAREQLNLSFQQFKLISKEDFGVDALTASYGYNVSYQPPGYDGSGELLFLEKQNTIIGVGTQFTSEIKVDDRIAVAEETRKVTAIASDTALTTDSDWSVTSGAAYTVRPNSPQTINGQGTLAFTIEDTNVTGTGTSFKSQANPGDEIYSAKQKRTIVSINSDTELTVNEAWPLIADGAAFKIIKPPKPAFTGQGAVVVTKDSAIVIGMGTRFSSDFTIGDSIQIEGTIKNVASLQSDGQLTVDSAWDVNLGNRFTVMPQPVLKKVTSYLPHTGTGTLEFTVDSTLVKGANTKFTSELSIGDQIQCAKAIRTVTTIASDTELTVSAHWELITTDASFIILPAQGLDIVDNFLARTGLSRSDLDKLFVQDLSPKELESGIANGFFINDTDENEPYLQTYFANDPANPVSRIKGITLKRLDRLNRFIRLKQLTGWSSADLDWLFATCPVAVKSEIGEEVLIYLAQVKTLQQALPEASVAALIALWSDVKTIGKVQDNNPQDLFDTVFNNSVFLNGKDPYKDEGVPFNPFLNPPKKWNIDSIDGLNGVIRNRLSAALSLDTDDVARLGNYVNTLTGGSGKTLPLNLANLSWMYRISQWSALLDLNLDELFNLLCLKYYPESPYDAPPTGKVKPDTNTYPDLSTAVQKAENNGLDIYQLAYIVNGATGAHYEPSYPPSDIAPFVDELAAAALTTHLSAADLVFEGTNNDQAAYLYDRMQNVYISPSGVFLKYEFDYDDSAQYFPVTEKDKNWTSGFQPDTFSLTFSDISADESQKVFNDLVSKTILIVIKTDLAKLSSEYTDDTDLSFLTPIFNEDEAPKKISEVRLLLSQSKNAIAHTLKVWRDTERKQQDILENLLSTFIASSKAAVKSLKDFASKASGLTGYLDAFLTPALPVSDKMKVFIEVLARGALLTSKLSLTEKETVYIASAVGGAHFNIEHLTDISIENVMSLIDYRKLVTDFADRNDELIDYFRLPKDGNCPGEKIRKLSAVTGWDADQICALIALFWPENAEPLFDYDTVAGIRRLQTSFDAGKKLGADIRTLLTFADIGRLDLAPEGVFSDKNWNVFESTADRTVSLVGNRFGDDAFAEVNSSVQESLNTQTRDILLPFSIWRINAYNPHIARPSDLYQYLLIDVEISGCALTSKIAQGIASVQLYMQRCRMMLEPGVNIVDIPKIWWSWMSSYRIWEVNRKVFLYPENYIEPTLRKKVTPAFKAFSDNLLQNDINKDTVKDPYQKYLLEIDLLSNLVHVASYNTTRLDALTGEEKETLFLIGRTNTQPYTYYMRKLDDLEDWGSWLKIDIAINAVSVTPVYAFNRIFIFWTEKSTMQSSTVKGQESSTETVEIVDMKFSFYDEEKWIHPQVLFSKIPVNAFPSNYSSITPEIQNLLDDQNSFWNIPYVLASGKGFVGKGRLDISAGLPTMEGRNTQFLHEAVKGDSVWCMGEKRIIGRVIDNQTMVVTKPWSNTADNCEYKIVPRENENKERSFTGTGKVTVTADLQNVSGEGTLFKSEISYGDIIIIGNETRMVLVIASDTELIVDSVWQTTAVGASFQVTLKKEKGEQLFTIFGANLPNGYDTLVEPPPIYVNPTKNLFIGERNDLNKLLYNTFSLAKQMGPAGFKIDGSVALGLVYAIDENLVKNNTNLVMTNYKYASETNPLPYGAILDRKQANLVVVNIDNLLKNNYWGNNLADTANNVSSMNQGASKRLLDYISKEKSSLINVSNQPGWFLYDNSDEAFLVQAQQNNLNKLTDMALIRERVNSNIISTQAFTVVPVPFNELKFKFTRLSTSVTSRLIQKLFAGGVDNLLTMPSQELSELPFSRFYPAPGINPPESVIPPGSSIMDFDGSYGLYFWEIFFHCPFLVADRLNMNKRYEDSKKWLEYIFNPTINEDDSANPDPEKRYWRFRPFRTMERESLGEMLTNQAQIRRYNYDPFDPDAIAKYRHAAYAKAVVMKYIDNLLDWGDFLFTQDTSESINQATNLYMLAADLLGKRPESQGKLPVQKAKSFNDIRKEYGEQIPQFLIELENTPEVQTDNAPAVGFSNVPFNKINSYFCVPENSDFASYWDRVEDRLFKIRHCQNIKGVYRQLALFAPPIDPRAFIRAYAAGGGFGLTSSFNAPVPNFRFNFLIEKARSLTSQVSNLGNALLAALEKKDAEALNLVRLQQEKTVLQLTTRIKEMQIKTLEQQKAAQQASLNNAAYRYTHYDNLLKDGISNREQVSLDAALAAMILNFSGTITKTAASIGYAVPQVGSPFAMTYGGQQLGNALNAASGAFEIGAIISNYVSQQSLTMAGYDRREQDWTLQRDMAQYDKAQIEAQLKETDIQQQIAQQDLVIHLQNLKNDDDLESFYKDKFTNEELYQWMSARISTAYFQAYNLAYTMAKAAERAYQYQYDSELSFINYNYWDNLYKGLGAAEGLMLALDQMESSSTLDLGSRSLEIEKSISLLQLNPKALLDLKATGECIFELNEKLFDYDFPGHYARKIKTLSISVPAVVGPYQNIHATLTQLSNQLVLKTNKQGLDAVNYLLGGNISKIPGNDVLRSNSWVNQQIALSKGMNDAGMFQLNFEDARFLPFEGTGAVSTWKLSMPFTTNRIRFDAISDVVIDLKYTALDGGETFRQSVMKLKAFKPYSGVGYCNLSQMYATAWYAFMNNHTAPDTQTLNFDLSEFVPPHITKTKLIGFYFKLDAATSAPGSYVTVKVSNTLSVVINLSPDNDYTYIFKKEGKSEPPVSEILGERSITFEISKTPPELKGKDNFLNPETVKNIEIIWFYDGEAETA